MGKYITHAVLMGDMMTSPFKIHGNMVNNGEYMNTPPLMENIMGDKRESYGNIFDNIEKSCGI